MTEEMRQKVMRWMSSANIMEAQVKHYGRYYLVTLTDRPDDASDYPFDVSVREIPAPIKLAF